MYLRKMIEIIEIDRICETKTINKANYISKRNTYNEIPTVKVIEELII